MDKVVLDTALVARALLADAREKMEAVNRRDAAESLRKHLEPKLTKTELRYFDKALAKL
jgi:hypothetical protein